MKRKLVFIFLIFLACLVALFIFSLFTSNVLGQSDREQPLSRIPDDRMFNRFRCGEYFLSGITSSEDDRFRIGIIFKTEDNGPLELEAGAFLPEMYTIIFDENKVTPTIKFVSNKNGGSRIILKISREEFERSPCLKKCFDANRI